MVNNNSNWLISYGNRSVGRGAAAESAAPGGDCEDAVSLSKIAGGGSHDGALGEHERAAGLDRQPHVLLANEVERSGPI